ncbi:hypothetical protein C5Z25_01480 [Lactobacillus sp. CBA3605]|nr:hypothetical protein C5Z25_01480 [Lactobacillus sp. CBA3605]
MLSTKIVKLGNSQGLRLQKSLLKEIGIVNPINTPVHISVEDGKILITPVKSESKIAHRFDNFDLESYRRVNKPVEYDWGEPVGKEMF